jgi:hypothetical protein
MAARALTLSTAAAWAPSGSEDRRHLEPISPTAGFTEKRFTQPTDCRQTLTIDIGFAA